MNRRLVTLALALVAGLVLCATPVQAGLSYNLSDFINTPETISGPAVSPLSFTGVPTSLVVTATGGASFDPTTITVTGVSGVPLLGGGPGLQYTGATFSVTAGQTLDVDFTYIVNAPSNIIEDASMLLKSSAISGTGSITITESIFAADDITPLANVLVVNDPVADTPYDQKFFTATNEAIVDKDIALVGGTGGASFSIMYQDFSITPEPTTALAAITGLPLLGLGLWLRRRGK